jgi:hypothetical protein
MVEIQVNGGVIFSKCTATGDWNSGLYTAKVAQDSQSWATNDTMGMNDSTGKRNIYVEDCDCITQANGICDADDGSRIVHRYSRFLNAAPYNSHGLDTSAVGTRHFEIYNCDINYQNSGWPENNIANGWFFIRGGTGLIYNNAIDVISGDPGSKPTFKLTIRGAEDARPMGSCAATYYPVPRQLGQSWRDGSYVTDPIYFYGNTGGAITYAEGFVWGNPCGFTWSDFFTWNRDGVKTGATKSGYSPYTYPHPLATGDTPSPPMGTPVLSVR